MENSRLLVPFKRWFRCPNLNTPFTTFTIPPIPITMTVICASFMFICGGLVLCYTQGIPMMAYMPGPNGRPEISWIETRRINSQLTVEGIVVGLIFIGSTLAFLAAAQSIRNIENPSEFQKICRYFSYTLPMWVFLLFTVFNKKIGSYIPSPIPLMRR